VWRLMEAWGFDQPAMEEWMERNVIDNADGIRFLDRPLDQFHGDCIRQRQELEERLKARFFPADFERYRLG